MLNGTVDESYFSRAACRGKDVEIFGQHDVARSHVEHAFTRRARHGFHCADGDGVFAGGQMGDGDLETFSIDVFAKGRCIVTGTFDRGGRIVFPMRKVPADTHLLTTGGADFVRRQCGQTRKPQASQYRQGNRRNEL